MINIYLDDDVLALPEDLDLEGEWVLMSSAKEAMYFIQRTGLWNIGKISFGLTQYEDGEMDNVYLAQMIEEMVYANEYTSIPSFTIHADNGVVEVACLITIFESIKRRRPT